MLLVGRPCGRQGLVGMLVYGLWAGGGDWAGRGAPLAGQSLWPQAGFGA